MTRRGRITGSRKSPPQNYPPFFSSGTLCFRVLFLFVVTFSPRSRNNFVKSPRRRRNDEGGTTALRGDCIRPSSHVLHPLSPLSLVSLPLSLVTVIPGVSPFLSSLSGVAAHAPGVSFLSILRARAPSSVLSLFHPFAHPLSRARSISYSFFLRVSCRSLATFALVRGPLYRCIQARRIRPSHICAFTRSTRSSPFAGASPLSSSSFCPE